MRMELLINMGGTTLGLNAVVAGFFGMNLHSGLEEAPQHLLWYVMGSTVCVSFCVLWNIFSGRCSACEISGQNLQELLDRL